MAKARPSRKTRQRSRKRPAARAPRARKGAIPKPAQIVQEPTKTGDTGGGEDTLIPGMIRTGDEVARGPRKKRAPSAPAPRLINHKTRALWFQSRSAWPMREAAINRVVRERDAVFKATPPAPGTAEWEPVGPSNIGGRMTALVCDADRPDRIWAGAAGGGVWYSPDAGHSWRAQWHSEDVLNVGSLAIDPRNSDILYCGTGEANLSADSYPGVGVYRTIDGGTTWHLHASCEKAGVPRRIGVIAIDPFDSQRLFLGGVGFGEVSAQRDHGGLYISIDGGRSWTRQTFVTLGNYWCHSVVFDPSKRGLVYAAVTARGARNGIYRTKDGGATWEQLTNGLEPTDRFGRATLAISPSNPRVLYAFASDDHSRRADMLLGVFKTTNGGDTWTNVAGTHFRNEGQISYGNTIAVHPTKPNHVICGGVDLHLTTDGGGAWKRVTRWDADRGTSGYAHADHHGLLMPAGVPGRIYDPNDGGVDISEDGGQTWKNRSDGLAVTMYYDLDVAQSDARVYGGGTQDNGTLITTSGRADDHREILGGDGGWIAFDPKEAAHLFASYYNLNIFRFRKGRWKDVSPPAEEDEKNSVWMAFLALAPTDTDTLYAGSSRLWRTRDDGDSWTDISPVFDGSTISAIELSRSDSRRIYVGTENGGFFRSVDGGATWSANLSSTLPGHSITRIGAVPDTPDRVFVTIANFGHSHVFRSDDAGSTWQDVDLGQLPDVPHHSLVVRPDMPETIWVCNDAGVFVSQNGGTTWLNLSRNLPRVSVVDLAFHAAKRWLFAATYGRSVFRLALE